jgi:hypothetical protein
MSNFKGTGLSPDFSHLPSWVQQGTKTDDSWMPVPMPAPIPMVDFNTFDPAYNFAWPDPMLMAQDTSFADPSMDSMNLSYMDWSYLRDSGQGW